MASLNTLRTKGGLFLSIVIGIALLAFILGDFGGRNRNHNPTVGEINDTKITYQEFEAERRFQEMRFKGANVQDAYEQTYDMAWASMLMRLSYEPGFEKLGLTISNEEMLDMVGGVFISPILTQNFRNPETGAYDPRILNDYMMQLRQQGDTYTWPFIERQIKEERMMSNFMALVSGGMFVNNIELELGVAAENYSRDARVIFKPYSEIPDSEVAVSDAEIKKYWEDHKVRFKRTAFRDIEYVAFEIVPSADDMEKGRLRAEELAAEFAAATNAEVFATLNSPDDKTPPRFVNESTVDPRMAEALFGKPEAVYGPVLNGNTFTTSRLAESRSLPDSVNLSMIALFPTDVNLADSLMRVANGSNFADLARLYSRDRQTAPSGGEVGNIDPALILANDPVMAEAVLAANKGAVTRVTGNEGYIYIIHVVNKTAPVRKVKIATVTYIVRPSSATEYEILGRAQEFHAKANGSYDNFRQAATEMALPKRMARVNSSSRDVDGMENSIRLVRWAHDHKKGTVSDPEKIGNDFIVAVITGIAEAGTASLEEVTAEIRELLARRKKGELLAERMNGSSIDQIAEALNLQVIEAEGVQMGQFSVPGIGMELRLIGAISTTEQIGKLSDPVKGSQGVYRFEVSSIDGVNEMTADDVRIKIESMNSYYLPNFIINALLEKSNVQDRRALYF